MNFVAYLEVVFPNQQVGQGNCEVVHAYLIEEVVLAVVDELVEASVCFIGAAEAQEGKTLIEDLVGLSVVVVEGCGWFGRTECSLFPALTRFVGIAEGIVSHAEEVVEVALLCAIELSFTEVMRIHKALLEQLHCIFITLLADGNLSQLYAGKLILCRHLSFAAFPWVEDVTVEELLGFCIFAGLVEEGDFLKQQVVALCDKPGVLLQQGKTLGVRVVQTLVELVELHEDARVALVECKCTLH